MELRCLPKSPTTNPALRAAGSRTHTHWNRLPFVSFCAFNTFLPLGLLNFTFIECNGFYQVLPPQSLWQVFKCDVHVPVEEVRDLRLGKVQCLVHGTQHLSTSSGPLKPKHLSNSATALLSTMLAGALKAAHGDGLPRHQDDWIQQ